MHTHTYIHIHTHTHTHIIHKQLLWFVLSCRIDQNFVIKVADFGLSEDIYSRNYFRQGQVDEGESVKLPIRWMALESLLDSVFTEKTDVVRNTACTH